jgi:hypothetical protein
MSDTKTIPTGPGAYYLANGQPAVAWWSCGGLLFRAEAESTTWADAPTAAWATGPDGEPVRVPTLGEWGEAVGQVQASDWWRNRANELVIEQNAAKQDAHQARAERDKAIADLTEANEVLRRRMAAVDEERNALVHERDALRSEVVALREVHARWQALREALDVPDGVDAVEWAGALVVLACAARKLLVATDSESGQAVALVTRARRVRAALEALDALRTPSRPLPDGPGWWWAVSGGEDVPVRVAHECGLLAGELRDRVWQNVASDAWTWLVIDGKAVRCTPPEVTRD